MTQPTPDRKPGEMPESWPVPRPTDGRAEARRFLDALHARGAIDEGTPQVVDRLVDNWVTHWLRGAGADREKAYAAAEQRIADAESDADYARNCLADARGRLAYAREALLRAGRRPEPNVAQAEWGAGEGDTPRTTRGRHPQPPGQPPAASVDPAHDHSYIPLAVDEPLPEAGDGTGQVRTAITWTLLGVMAGADAFGFWQTLVGIVQKDTTLTAFFVVALTTGAVLVAYQIGRMARRIADGYAGGGVPWLATMSAAWLGLGLVAFWIRAHPSVIPELDSQNSGVFGGAASAAASPGVSWSQTWGYASLLLLLYVATGILTITDAWIRESPQRRTFGLLTLRLRETQHEVASYRRHLRAAEAAVQLAKNASARARRDHSVEDSCLDEGRGIKEDCRVHLAQLLGNPSSTAAVLNTRIADAGGGIRRDDPVDDEPDDDSDGAPGNEDGSD